MNSPKEVNTLLWSRADVLHHNSATSQQKLATWQLYFNFYLVWLRSTELNKFYKHLEKETKL